MQEELAQIRENYNQGFITAFEAIKLTIDTLEHAGEDIEDEDERDAWMQTVYASHRDCEHFTKAWEEISEQWYNF